MILKIDTLLERKIVTAEQFHKPVDSSFETNPKSTHRKTADRTALQGAKKFLYFFLF